MTHKKTLQLKANELANANALKKVVTVLSVLRNETYLSTIMIEAIKTLNTAIENASKSQVNDNLLFAKLLAYVMIRICTRRYKSID
jgi:uncharacterized membrane protein